MNMPEKVVLVAKPWRGGLANYLARALEEMFPGRVGCLYTYPTTRQDKLHYRLDKRAWRMCLLERIQRLDADLVLFVNLLPEFAGLQRKPSHVLWLTDSPEPVLGILDPFAHVFLSDPGYAGSLRRAVGEARFAGVLPFACQPDVHMPGTTHAGAAGFCFIANHDAKRDRLLQFLFTHDRRVRVYGNYFLRHPLFWRYPAWFRPPVANRHMGGIYARHAAALNVHAEVVREGTNMRTFECAAYGVPQMVEYRPGLESYFDPDGELYVYRDEAGLIELMAHVEAYPEEARRRAVRARARALSEHTYRQRIEQILCRL
ncbi:MAG TPA: glycosyltransferase [Gammaproteobacteria bacterium]